MSGTSCSLEIEKKAAQVSYEESNQVQTPTGSSCHSSWEKSPDNRQAGCVYPPRNLLEQKKTNIAMVALCVALFLAALDQTVVSTALPTIATHFHATQSGYPWIASSYLLANAACATLWGKVSDTWGRKPVILLANLAFLTGSLICGLAVNLTMILVGRAVQGAGGGGITVLANISVSDLFSVRERPVYYGMFAVTYAVANGLGPIIGGAFASGLTWRWCFYLNLPIGGLSLVVLFLFLRVESATTPLRTGLRSIDWLGMVLIIGGTLTFLLGIEFGSIGYPWTSPAVICLIIFGVVIWILAMLNEWGLANHPVIPVRLFNNWHNVTVLLICFCHGSVFVAASFYLPLYFQTILLASPMMSGVYILPILLSLSLCSTLVGFVIKKTGLYREVIIFGMFFLLLGVGLFIDLQPYASWPRIIIYQVIAGVGVGPNFQSPLVALQAKIHPSDAAAATATFAFIRQLSTSMSVVLGGVIYQNILSKQMPQIISAIGPGNAARVTGSFPGLDGRLMESLTMSQKHVIHRAYIQAFRWMWIVYTIIAGIGFILSLLINPTDLSQKHVRVKMALKEEQQRREGSEQTC